MKKMKRKKHKSSQRTKNETLLMLLELNLLANPTDGSSIKKVKMKYNLKNTKHIYA